MGGAAGPASAVTAGSVAVAAGGTGAGFRAPDPFTGPAAGGGVATGGRGARGPGGDGDRTGGRGTTIAGGRGPAGVRAGAGRPARVEGWFERDGDSRATRSRGGGLSGASGSRGDGLSGAGGSRSACLRPAGGGS